MWKLYKLFVFYLSPFYIIVEIMIVILILYNNSINIVFFMKI